MNGTMSFVKLGKVMNTSWKGCNRHAVFDNLAKEGRRHYQMWLREYLDGAGVAARRWQRGDSVDSVAAAQQQGCGGVAAGLRRRAAWQQGCSDIMVVAAAQRQRPA